jgi:hypothetical protein
VAFLFWGGNPIGLASLYLDGVFIILKENHHITLTNNNDFKKYIIELEE